MEATMIAKTILRTALALALLALSTTVAAAKDHALAGSWLIDATPAQDIVPPFKMLMTFHTDETLVETQNDQLALPFFATTGHGVWERTAPNTYSFTMLQLLFDPNFTGTLVGTLKTRGTVVVHGSTIFSGEVAVEITDTDGNLLFSGGGAVDGKRIVSEPLN
jgi:hypothetical protein